MPTIMPQLCWHYSSGLLCQKLGWHDQHKTIKRSRYTSRSQQRANSGVTVVPTEAVTLWTQTLPYLWKQTFSNMRIYQAVMIKNHSLLYSNVRGVARGAVPQEKNKMKALFSQLNVLLQHIQFFWALTFAAITLFVLLYTVGIWPVIG